MSSTFCKRDHRSNSYQELEQRQLLAGNVTVFENVHLFIRGDGADNQLEVVADGDQLKINGLNGTTINQQDSFIVQGTTVSDSGVTFDGGLRAHLGPGNDSVMVKDALFESMSIVYGGTGDDSVEVVDSGFKNQLTIQTYDGNDSVSTSGSHFDDTFRVLTLDGQDTVTMSDSMLAGNSVVVTGNHADEIHSQGNHYMGDVNLVLTFGGNDAIDLTNPVVGENQLGIFLGDGDDTVRADLTDSSIDGTIRIGGQGGIDEAAKMEMSDDVADSVMVGTMERGEVYDTDANVGMGLYSYFYGDRNLQYTASRVTFDEATRIRGIEWTGLYDSNDIALDDVFTINVFEDDFYDTQWEGQFNAPVGDPLASFSVGNDFGIDVNRTDTGEVLEGRRPYDEDQNIFSYSAEIDFEMEAGKSYWISIVGRLSALDSQSTAPLWQWGFEPPEYTEVESTEVEESASFVGGYNNRDEWVTQWIGFDGKLDMKLRT